MVSRQHPLEFRVPPPVIDAGCALLMWLLARATPQWQLPLSAGWRWGLLLAGLAVGGGMALAGLIANSKNPKEFSIVGETLSVEPYGVMMRKDDPQLKAVVDRVIVGMMKSGELDKLYTKWFMSPIPPKNINLNLPMSPELKAAIKNPTDKGI